MDRMRVVVAELLTPILTYCLLLTPLNCSLAYGEYQAGCTCCREDTIPGNPNGFCSGSCPNCQTRDMFRARQVCAQASPGFPGVPECYMQSNRIGSRTSCVLTYNMDEYEECLWWTGAVTLACVACLVGTIAGSGGTITVLCAGVCASSQIAVGYACDTCEVKQCVSDPNTVRDIMRDEISRGGGALITCPGLLG